MANTTNINTNLFEEFKTIFTSNFDSTNTLVVIPMLSINQTAEKVASKRFQTNLKKIVKQEEKPMIEFKRTIMLQCLCSMYTLFNTKCNDINNIIKSALEYSIDEDAKTLAYFLENSDGEKDEGHIKDISLYLYWNEEKEHYKKLYEDYFKQINKTMQNKINTNLLMCISALIVGSPLPTCFNKESTDFKNICDNSIVYFRNVEKEKGKQLTIQEVNATKKRLKAHIIEFYQKYLQFEENCKTDDETFTKLSGGCNIEMLNKIASRIYSGSKINKKGIVVGIYNGHSACAKELSAVYISYLQGEFSIDNSK